MAAAAAPRAVLSVVPNFITAGRRDCGLRTGGLQEEGSLAVTSKDHDPGGEDGQEANA